MRFLAAVQRQWWEAEKDACLKPYLPPGGLMAAARAIVQNLEQAPWRVELPGVDRGEGPAEHVGQLLDVRRPHPSPSSSTPGGPPPPTSYAIALARCAQLPITTGVAEVRGSVV